MDEVVEVDAVEADADVVEVERFEVPGSKDLEPFFLLKKGFVVGILFLCHFHPFGIWDGCNCRSL